VFATEAAETKGDYRPGDNVDVLTSRGGFVGRGYINPASQILVRLLTRRPGETIDEDFYRHRVREAVALRAALFAGVSDIDRRAFRLIFAEADHLPALIVDYYAGHLVFQALALGVDVVKDLLMRLVREEAGRAFPVLSVYERDDAPVRELEGLRLVTGPLWGETPPRVAILENDVTLAVDIAGGQKTGYFLDQRENRAAIAPYVVGGRVLDCFCYTGGFAIAAARYGARVVLGVDTSGDALGLARENAGLNGLEVGFVEANVFDFLRAEDASGRDWDTVVLDPPAFAKNKAALAGALRGYKEINLRAMKVIRPGGYLVTSSCSQYVGEEVFRDVLASAAADTRRRIQVVEVRSQARDHPTLAAAPETRYLKFFVLRVL